MSYIYRQPYPNELWHHGILGMKWGVRRYQNPDGSYTEAGKKRYAKAMADEAYKYKNYLYKNHKFNAKSPSSPYNNRKIQEAFNKNIEQFNDIADKRSTLDFKYSSMLNDFRVSPQYIEFRNTALKDSNHPARGSDELAIDAWLASNSKTGQEAKKFLDEINALDNKRNELSGKIADDLLGVYGSTPLKTTYYDSLKPVNTVKELATSILDSKGYRLASDLEMDKWRSRKEETQKQVGNDWYEFLNKSNKLTYEWYAALDESLEQMGGSKYRNLPTKTKHKLISDYDDVVPKDEGPGGKDYSSEFRLNSETKYFKAKDYYDRYKSLHPNSELTFNEFKEWNIVNDD